jgi:hypothetical protein
MAADCEDLLGPLIQRDENGLRVSGATLRLAPGEAAHSSLGGFRFSDSGDLH